MVESSVDKSLVEKSEKTTLDWVGVALSGFCFIHCLGGPILLYLSPLLAEKYLNHGLWTHLLLVFVIMFVAFQAFWRGYRRHHQWKPLVWMTIGLGLILFDSIAASGILLGSSRTHDHLSSLPLISMMGSLALIWAHYQNIRYQSQCLPWIFGKKRK